MNKAPRISYKNGLGMGIFEDVCKGDSPIKEQVSGTCPPSSNVFEFWSNLRRMGETLNWWTFRKLIYLFNTFARVMNVVRSFVGKKKFLMLRKTKASLSWL